MQSENQGTDKIARAIAALYKSVLANIRVEERKFYRLFGREFTIGTRYSYTFPGKVAYYVYMENRKVEFYFIYPKQYLSYLCEKMTDVWGQLQLRKKQICHCFRRRPECYQLTYTKEDALSLAVDRRSNDLLNSNLNAVEMLEEGDKLGILYNFIPSSQISRKHHYKATIDKVNRRLPVDRDKMGAWYLFQFLISAGNAVFNKIAVALGERKVEGAINALETLSYRLQGHLGIGENTIRKASCIPHPTLIHDHLHLNACAYHLNSIHFYFNVIVNSCCQRKNTSKLSSTSYDMGPFT